MSDTALSPTLAKHRAGASVWLRLQRPAAMNAISTDLLDELNLALDEIEADASVPGGRVDRYRPGILRGR